MQELIIRIMKKLLFSKQNKSHYKIGVSLDKPVTMLYI